MNDASEFKYANDVLWEAMERAKQGAAPSKIVILAALQKAVDLRTPEQEFQFPNAFELTFVTSFTRFGNQLSQWRAYGGSGGYALGFASTELQQLDPDFELVECTYAPKQHSNAADKLVGEILEKLNGFSAEILERFASISPGQTLPSDLGIQLLALRQFVTHRILQISPSWKHHSFSEEAEWRLVSRTSRNGKVAFRSGRSQIVPYTEINLTPPAGQLITAIREVNVGPGSEPEFAKANVNLLLRMNRFKVESINVPEHPLRASW
jgi:hypothetical protein